MLALHRLAKGSVEICSVVQPLTSCAALSAQRPDSSGELPFESESSTVGQNRDRQGAVLIGVCSRGR